MAFTTKYSKNDNSPDPKKKKKKKKVGKFAGGGFVGGFAEGLANQTKDLGKKKKGGAMTDIAAGESDEEE
jgi:hypothetical protein